MSALAWGCNSAHSFAIAVQADKAAPCCHAHIEMKHSHAFSMIAVHARAFIVLLEGYWRLSQPNKHFTILSIWYTIPSHEIIT